MTWSFNIALVKNMEMQMACPESLMSSVTAMKQGCPPHHSPVVVVLSAPKSIANSPILNLMLMT